MDRKIVPQKTAFGTTGHKSSQFLCCTKLEFNYSSFLLGFFVQLVMIQFDLL